MCLFSGSSWVRIEHKVAEAYIRTRWHRDPSSRLTKINMGRKLGGSAPFLGTEVGFPSNTKSPWLRTTSIPSGIFIHPAIWPQQIWAENWGLCRFWGGEMGPHLTQWPGPRPTCMPSFVLIRPTIWPQCTNVTDRQSIAFRVASIYWQGVAPFPWYLNAKVLTPSGSTCVAHTSPHSTAAMTSLRH